MSSAATATPSGNIQNPITGKKPKTPPSISNRPSTKRRPGGRLRLDQTCTLQRVRRNLAAQPVARSGIAAGLQNVGLLQPAKQRVGRGLGGLKRGQMACTLDHLQLGIRDQISHEAMAFDRRQTVLRAT